MVSSLNTFRRRWMIHLYWGSFFKKDDAETRFSQTERVFLRFLEEQATPELTRGNRKSQFHEFTGESMLKVDSHYPSRGQWLQLPNSTARRRIQGGSSQDDGGRRANKKMPKVDNSRPVSLTFANLTFFSQPPLLHSALPLFRGISSRNICDL